MQRVDPVKPSNSGTIVRSLGPDATPGRQVRFSRLTYQYVRNPWHVPVLEPLAQAPPMRSDLAVARVPQSVRSIMDGNPPRLSLITTPFTHRSLYAWGLLAWAYWRTRSWSHRRPPSRHHARADRRTFCLSHPKPVPHCDPKAPHRPPTRCGSPSGSASSPQRAPSPRRATAGRATAVRRSGRRSRSSGGGSASRVVVERACWWR
jgi:hypothetical protein